MAAFSKPAGCCVGRSPWWHIFSRRVARLAALIQTEAACWPDRAVNELPGVTRNELASPHGLAANAFIADLALATSTFSVAFPEAYLIILADLNPYAFHTVDRRQAGQLPTAADGILLFCFYPTSWRFGYWRYCDYIRFSVDWQGRSRRDPQGAVAGQVSGALVVVGIDCCDWRAIARQGCYRSRNDPDGLRARIKR